DDVMCDETTGVAWSTRNEPAAHDAAGLVHERPQANPLGDGLTRRPPGAQDGAARGRPDLRWNGRTTAGDRDRIAGDRDEVVYEGATGAREQRLAHDRIGSVEAICACGARENARHQADYRSAIHCSTSSSGFSAPNRSPVNVRRSYRGLASMAVSLSPGTVHGWDGWWIRRELLELGLVPSIGGR